MNEEMRYQEPERVERREAVKVFRAGKPEEVARVLLSMSLKDADLDFALLWCLFFLNHEDDRVAGASAVSIGHLARIHKRINKAVVIPALEIARDEGRIAGQATDALEDIATFCTEGDPEDL